MPMVLNRTIQIRLTRDQYERIKDYSRMRGFSSLSSYLRFVALNQDFLLHDRICEIHSTLLGAGAARKSGKPALTGARI